MGTSLKNRSLKMLREQRRLDLSDVATFANISKRRLQTFEEGDQAPSRKQLERLAKLYGVPLYALYADAIPNISDTPTDFRKSNLEPASLSPRGIKRLLDSEKIATFTKQLAVELKYDPPNWSNKASQFDSPNDRAISLRGTFNSWLSAREAALELSGPIEQKTLSALRIFFEAQGGVVNVNDAPAEDYMGFYLRPEGALETIFVNRSIASKKAQLFTLAHEYAHALIKQEGISNPFVVRNSVERSCNEFAAEFLAPMETFKRLAESQPNYSRGDVNLFVSSVSSQSLLSKHATAIRLSESGYITEQQLHTWESAWSFDPKTEKTEEKGGGTVESVFGVPHAKRISELGYLPVYLSGEAIRRNLIDSIDVQSGIGLSETLQERAFALASRRINAALR